MRPRIISLGMKSSTKKSGVSLGQRLRRARQANGLTLTQLAARVGSTQPTLSRIERGQGAGPKWELVAELASVLGLDLRELTPEPVDYHPVDYSPSLDAASSASFGAVPVYLEAGLVRRLQGLSPWRERTPCYPTPALTRVPPSEARDELGQDAYGLLYADLTTAPSLHIAWARPQEYRMNPAGTVRPLVVSRQVNGVVELSVSARKEEAADTQVWGEIVAVTDAVARDREAPYPARFRVECGGSDHVIEIDSDGQIHTLNHPNAKATTSLILLGAPRQRCLELWQAWQSGNSKNLVWNPILELARLSPNGARRLAGSEAVGEASGRLIGYIEAQLACTFHDGESDSGRDRS
jgi:transcriptional regulator with XRE-family HTH domain